MAQRPASIRWIVFFVIAIPFSWSWVASPFCESPGKRSVLIFFIFSPAIFTLLYFFGIVNFFFCIFVVATFLTLHLGYYNFF